MTRSYAQFATSIWRDADFLALPSALQRVYMMLSSQADVSAVGVLHLSITRWAGRAPDTTVDDIEHALAGLAERRFIVLDRQTEELFLRSFVRWDNGYKNPKRLHSIRDAADAVESAAIVASLATEFDRLGVAPGYRGQCSADRAKAIMRNADEKVSCSAFPQVDSPSIAYSDSSDSPSIEDRRVPQPTTHNNNPQPATPAAPAAATATAVLDRPAEPITDVSQTPGSGVVPPSWLSPGSDAAKANWEAANHQPRTGGPRVPKQSIPEPLFAVTRQQEIERLPEAQRIIGDWLRLNGFPHVNGADCAAVHQAVIRRYPDKVGLEYLRGIASGGGFASFYQPIIEARADAINKQIRWLTEGQPDCGHGFLGGSLAHPTTGLALCPGCRAGAPIPVRKLSETTHPDVRAALDTYRNAYRSEYGAAPLLPLLMSVTGEAETLRRQQVAPDAIAGIAARAGSAGATLLETVSSLKGQAT